MSDATPVLLALGTNLGDRAANLAAAVRAVASVVTITNQSAIYATPPWGVTTQPAFFNACLAGTTQLAPLELLDALKDAEAALGRVPGTRWGPRLIDLDLLAYGGLVLDSVRLTLPHPRLHERGFVLVPLVDVAPEWRHPILGLTARDLLSMVDTAGITVADATLPALEENTHAG